MLHYDFRMSFKIITFYTWKEQTTETETKDSYEIKASHLMKFNLHKGEKQIGNIAFSMKLKI